MFVYSLDGDVNYKKPKDFLICCI